MYVQGTASKFAALGADADSTHGLNVHGAIVDEIHAHQNRDLWDVLETASGSRRQPLRFAITTAGFDRESLCWQLHELGTAILAGTVTGAAADSRFVYIASLDEGDDPFDEDVWPKANPNLDVSVKRDDMREAAERAKAMPGALNAFLRLRLNVWTESETRWLSPEGWDACGGRTQIAIGASCFGGLDLGSTTDLSSLVLLFPGADGWFDILVRFWCPEDGMRARVARDRVPYDVWAREGYLSLTPGNVTDYDRIREDIRALADEYAIVEIGYDRWNATQLVVQLVSDGARMEPVGQGFRDLSAPSRELEKLVLGATLRHGNNPVLRWMARNVVVEQDAAGNLRPSKRASTERIDGIVALVMALARAMVASPAVGTPTYWAPWELE